MSNIPTRIIYPTGNSITHSVEKPTSVLNEQTEENNAIKKLSFDLKNNIDSFLKGRPISDITDLANVITMIYDAFYKNKVAPVMSMDQYNLLQNDIIFVVKGINKAAALTFDPTSFSAIAVDSNEVLSAADMFTEQVEFSYKLIEFVNAGLNYNVERLYSSLIFNAEKVLQDHRAYWNLYNYITKMFVDSGSAAVTYDKVSRKLLMLINKAFICNHPFGFLLTGSPNVLYSAINSNTVEEKIAFSVAWVIMHEIGHILRLQTSSKETVYDNFSNEEVNILGDCVINHSLSAKFPLSSRTNTALVPMIYLGTKLTSTGQAKGSLLQSFINKGLPFGKIILKPQVSNDVISGWAKLIPSRDYDVMTFMNTAYMLDSFRIKDTVHAIYIYKSIKDFFNFKVEDDSKEKSYNKSQPQKIPPLKPGDYVKDKATGKYGVVKTIDFSTGTYEFDELTKEQVESALAKANFF